MADRSPLDNDRFKITLPGGLKVAGLTNKPYILRTVVWEYLEKGYPVFVRSTINTQRACELRLTDGEVTAIPESQGAQLWTDKMRELIAEGP